MANNDFAEVELYFSLKAQLRRSIEQPVRSESSEKVDVEALKQEIKKTIQKKKKTRFTHRHKELRVEFEKRETGFSLFISRDKIYKICESFKESFKIVKFTITIDN